MNLKYSFKNNDNTPEQFREQETIALKKQALRELAQKIEEIYPVKLDHSIYSIELMVVDRDKFLDIRRRIGMSFDLVPGLNALKDLVLTVFDQLYEA